MGCDHPPPPPWRGRGGVLSYLSEYLTSPFHPRIQCSEISTLPTGMCPPPGGGGGGGGEDGGPMISCANADEDVLRAGSVCIRKGLQLQRADHLEEGQAAAVHACQLVMHNTGPVRQSPLGGSAHLLQ